MRTFCAVLFQTSQQIADEPVLIADITFLALGLALRFQIVERQFVVVFNERLFADHETDRMGIVSFLRPFEQSFMVANAAFDIFGFKLALVA